MEGYAAHIPFFELEESRFHLLCCTEYTSRKQQRICRLHNADHLTLSSLIGGYEGEKVYSLLPCDSVSALPPDTIVAECLEEHNHGSPGCRPE